MKITDLYANWKAIVISIDVVKILLLLASIVRAARCIFLCKFLFEWKRGHVCVYDDAGC